MSANVRNRSAAEIDAEGIKCPPMRFAPADECGFRSLSDHCLWNTEYRSPPNAGPVLQEGFDKGLADALVGSDDEGGLVGECNHDVSRDCPLKLKAVTPFPGWAGCRWPYESGKPVSVARRFHLKTVDSPTRFGTSSLAAVSIAFSSYGVRGGRRRRNGGFRGPIHCSCP